jgi:hypothetical protein
MFTKFLLTVNLPLAWFLVATALVAMGTKGKTPALEGRKANELNIDPSAF